MNTAQTTTTTGASGRLYTAPATFTICKLSDLSQDVEYQVVSVDKKPTKFGSYVVTIATLTDDDDECRVYMPEYIARHAKRSKCFVYKGLQKKSDGSGHSYHRVEWETVKKVDLHERIKSKLSGDSLAIYERVSGELV